MRNFLEKIFVINKFGGLQTLNLVPIFFWGSKFRKKKFFSKKFFSEKIQKSVKKKRNDAKKTPADAKTTGQASSRLRRDPPMVELVKLALQGKKRLLQDAMFRVYFFLKTVYRAYQKNVRAVFCWSRMDSFTPGPGGIDAESNSTIPTTLTFFEKMHP